MKIDYGIDGNSSFALIPAGRIFIHDDEAYIKINERQATCLADGGLQAFEKTDRVTAKPNAILFVNGAPE